MNMKMVLSVIHIEAVGAIARDLVFTKDVETPMT